MCCSLLHPEQPPPLVNTRFAPEGRPYNGAASPPASEMKLRPVVKLSQARSPPDPSSLTPRDTQHASKPDEVQPIFGQAIQLVDESLPLDESANGSNQAWFQEHWCQA